MRIAMEPTASRAGGVVRSFVTVDASQSVTEGLQAVRQRRKVRYVIVRCERPGEITWYSFLSVRFIALIEGLPPRLTLHDALKLDWRKLSAMHFDGSRKTETFVSGAIAFNVDGHPVGVVEIAESQGEGAVFRGGYGSRDASPESSDDAEGEAADGQGDYGTDDDSVGSVEGAAGKAEVQPSTIEFDADIADLGSDAKIEPDAAPGNDDDYVVSVEWESDRGDMAPSRPRLDDTFPHTRHGEPMHRRGRRMARQPGVLRERQAIKATVQDDHRPFAAWPSLVAPETVVPDETFELTVSFARVQQKGVTGGPVVLVDAPPEFDLRVQVVGAGFDAPQGWTHDLHVQLDDPWSARLSVLLVAKVSDRAVEARTLSVQFYYESNLCGQAQRTIVVANSDVSVEACVMAATTAPPASNVPITVGSGFNAPDLTVIVRLDTGRGQREKFIWSFESPHPIQIPQDPAFTELEQDAGTIVDSLLQGLVDLSDEPTARTEMRGIARQIARRVPSQFWKVLKDVALVIEAERRAPDVLFVTEETRLPWELAWMPEPLDRSRPNHLGAQVNFGRWILGNGRPTLPPEFRMSWQNMVVVVGNYPAATGLMLPDALEEARVLSERMPDRTKQVELSGVDLYPLLEGEDPQDGAEIIHFACHGEAMTGNAAASSLTMQDGKRFTPTTLGGSEMGHLWEPFLFLNACEVGRASVALGETAGFAGAALYEGFRAFIGPLWEVDSKVAREIAVEFYRRTLDGGEQVASVLRDVRSKYVYDGSGTSCPDTYLAYVFYGHPALRFARKH